jgi:hypothetical protein
VLAISNRIARTYGMPEDRLPTLTRKGGSMSLVNDPELVARLDPALQGLVGESSVLTDFPAAMGSADCAELIPEGSGIALDFVIVGTAPPAMVAAAQAEGKPVPFTNHYGDYVVDLDAIPLGARIGSTLPLELLGRDRGSRKSQAGGDLGRACASAATASPPSSPSPAGAVSLPNARRLMRPAARSMQSLLEDTRRARIRHRPGTLIRRPRATRLRPGLAGLASLSTVFRIGSPR